MLIIVSKFCRSGLPDRGYFGYNSPITHTPLRAIWFSTIFSILPGLLDLASPAAANAIFSLTAIALDLSYIIPIFLRRVFQDHPEVMFKPYVPSLHFKGACLSTDSGPFYMGDGLLGWAANVACISWTLFVCVIFSFPTLKPVTALNMNYASVSSSSFSFPSPAANKSFHQSTGHHDRRNVPLTVGSVFLRFFAFD
jgi:hypothetical protein